MKNNKKILTLFSVIILIIALFFFFHKSQNNNVNNSKNESTIKTEALDKNDGKTSEGNASTVKDESKKNQTSAGNNDTKEQGKNETTKVINNDEGITVFVKAANFGSTAEIVIDSSNFNSSYKYYEFFLGNKPISNIESITKNETTIFPAQEAGSEVLIKLLDENKKALKELKIKLNEKK